MQQIKDFIDRYANAVKRKRPNAEVTYQEKRVYYNVMVNGKPKISINKDRLEVSSYKGQSTGWKGTVWGHLQSFNGPVSIDKNLQPVLQAGHPTIEQQKPEPLTTNVASEHSPWIKEEIVDGVEYRVREFIDGETVYQMKRPGHGWEVIPEFAYKARYQKVFTSDQFDHKVVAPEYSDVKHMEQKAEGGVVKPIDVSKMSNREKIKLIDEYLDRPDKLSLRKWNALKQIVDGYRPQTLIDKIHELEQLEAESKNQPKKKAEGGVVKPIDVSKMSNREKIKLIDEYLDRPDKLSLRKWNALKQIVDGYRPQTLIAKIHELEQLESESKQQPKKKSEGGVVVDMFTDPDTIPKEVWGVFNRHFDMDSPEQSVPALKAAQKDLKELGYTFDYYLDGVPYDLRPVDQDTPKELGEGGAVSADLEKPDIESSYANPYLKNKAIEQLIAYKDAKGETYSQAEREFIAGYTGYGGLEKEATEEDQAAQVANWKYEFFTPLKMIEKMWGLAYKYGFKDGDSVLEPSCGIGSFLTYAPEQSRVVGYEINPTSKRISEILYPEFEFNLAPFETLFIKNNKSVKDNYTGEKYDLVIGNPPYGSFTGRYAYTEGKHTKAHNFTDYFIQRGLDTLNTGGLLVMVIGAEVAAGGKLFLSQKMTQSKSRIADKAELLDAYRLPNGVFDRTDVLTEIVVLQKK